MIATTLSIRIKKRKKMKSMKKNLLRYSFLLTFLAVLMLLTMSVSTQAAGVKTPGKVTITRVRLAGSSNV